MRGVIHSRTRRALRSRSVALRSGVPPSRIGDPMRPIPLAPAASTAPLLRAMLPRLAVTGIVLTIGATPCARPPVPRAVADALRAFDARGGRHEDHRHEAHERAGLRGPAGRRGRHPARAGEPAPGRAARGTAEPHAGEPELPRQRQPAGVRAPARDAPRLARRAEPRRPVRLRRLSRGRGRRRPHHALRGLARERLAARRGVHGEPRAGPGRPRSAAGPRTRHTMSRGAASRIASRRNGS